MAPNPMDSAATENIIKHQFSQSPLLHGIGADDNIAIITTHDNIKEQQQARGVCNSNHDNFIDDAATNIPGQHQEEQRQLSKSFSTASTVCVSNLDQTKENSSSTNNHEHQDSQQEPSKYPPSTIFIPKVEQQQPEQQTEHRIQEQIERTPKFSNKSDHYHALNTKNTIKNTQNTNGTHITNQNKIHQRVCEAKRKKQMVHRVCRILLEHLSKYHPTLYVRAKHIVEDCASKHHAHQIGYESLTWSIQRTFEHEFPKHWNKATEMYLSSKYIPSNGGRDDGEALGTTDNNSMGRGADADTSASLSSSSNFGYGIAHERQPRQQIGQQQLHNESTTTSKGKNDKFTYNFDKLTMIELENFLRSIGMEEIDILHMDRQDRIRTLSYLARKSTATASK